MLSTKDWVLRSWSELQSSNHNTYESLLPCEFAAKVGHLDVKDNYISCARCKQQTYHPYCTPCGAEWSKGRPLCYWCLQAEHSCLAACMTVQGCRFPGNIPRACRCREGPKWRQITHPYSDIRPDVVRIHYWKWYWSCTSCNLRFLLDTDPYRLDMAQIQRNAVLTHHQSTHTPTATYTPGPTVPASPQIQEQMKQTEVRPGDRVYPGLNVFFCSQRQQFYQLLP